MNKNFTFQEFVKSSAHPTLQAKEIPVDVVENLFKLWFHILQPLRDAYGKPIIITSGYRPEVLNTLVGGVKNSQHLIGQAVDLKGKSLMETRKLGSMIEQMCLPFDQLIYEPTWLHVSYGPKNRRQILKG